VMRLWAGWLVVRFPPGARGLLFFKTSRSTLGLTLLFIQRVPEAKRPGSEVDHFPPSSIEI
jgi:hypothetical protein